MGILAAVAAPKFIDLQRDAKISYLYGLKGAIESANQLLRSYAIVHGLDSLSIIEEDAKAKGTGDIGYINAMVKFEGNKIVKTTTDFNQTFF